MPATIIHGDCLAVLPTLADNSVDAVVTDPPYHLIHPTSKQGNDAMGRISAGFMDCKWDGGDIAFRVDVWRECLRVLKPGGHIVAFGGTRTYHRMAVAIEDAGFEIRDALMWVYSGFPKSHAIDKAIDKHLGAKREVIGKSARHDSRAFGEGWRHAGGVPDITAPATPQAAQWAGWGSALKPSYEPIILARKPLTGTLAANVMAHGTGGINVDGCRVPFESGDDKASWRYGAAGKGNVSSDSWKNTSKVIIQNEAAGRWPPNLLHDASDEVLGCFPRTKGRGNTKPAPGGGGMYGHAPCINDFGKGDDGSAARFFPALGYSDDERRLMYCPKASKRDRADSKHPTIKPLKLMQWLCTLICPPSGTILDPFAGSGTTGEAASNCGFNSILIEREAEYIEDIKRRLAMFIA